jgi:hypothetical protein
MDAVDVPVREARGKRWMLWAGLVLYIIPRTAVLGAVLLTGYLGGAIATYVRMGEPYRDERVRSLPPFRRRVLRP